MLNLKPKSMKLVSFLTEEAPRLGLLIQDAVYDLNQINPFIANNMADFLRQGEKGMDFVRLTEVQIQEGRFEDKRVKGYTLTAPVPFPTSFRDAYAFRQHVATSRENRGLEMIPEFDEFPVFYFSNHQAIQGPGEVACMPEHFHQLDFELEVAIAIHKKGRNILAKDAEDYIAGFMILNDFSARALQSKEMKLNLGPAKGKDFSTAIGPYLVTRDELEAFKIPLSGNHVGVSYDLKMICLVNGKQVSEGNLADMNWSFGEIIERASYGVDLFPGDIIGSGTVGTGCFLELNGTKKRANPEYQEQWLQAGDRVELEVEGLGKLTNVMVPYSLGNKEK